MTTASPSTTAYKAAHRLRVELARHDVNAFIEYVARDEETGRPLRQSALHRAWHELLDCQSRLILWAPICHGKSQQISILRTVWLLGRDPSLRIVIASNAARQAAKFVRSIAQHIERNPRVREVFANLKPARGLPWNESMLTLERPGIANDPSVQLISQHGNILSTRADLIVVDDILDYESCRTEAQREDTIDWVANALLGRLSPQRGRMVICGVAQHAKDLMHELARRGPPWAAFRFGALDSQGEPRWPEKWSAEALAAKRRELGPLEASRQLDCRASSDDSSYIKMEWVQPALERGNGLTTVDRFPSADLPYDPLDPIQIVHGVDIAVSKRRTADLAAIFTLAVHPNGIKQVLSVQAGRWGWPDLKSRLIDVHRRYGGKFVVENNATQEIALEELKALRRGSSVVAFTTGTGERSLKFQVDRLVSEMTRGEWCIPNKAGWTEPSIAAWLEELAEYDPEEHPGDRLAASLFARWGSDRGGPMAEVAYLDTMSR
jgi:hypothetical protein